MHVHIHAYIPGTWWPSIYNWLFQLDDEPNLYNGEWLEITKHPFKTGCLEFQVCSIQYTYYVFERLHWPSWKSSLSSPWDHATHRCKWKTWPQEKLCFRICLFKEAEKTKKLWTRKDVLIKLLLTHPITSRLENHLEQIIAHLWRLSSFKLRWSPLEIHRPVLLDLLRVYHCLFRNLILTKS